MSSAAQINANQQNAQLSTGPVSEAGRQRSSQNSTRHGYSGKTLVLSPEEWDAYQVHVQEYMDGHNVSGHRHRQLVQQLADLDWSIHQIFVEQTGMISLLSEVAAQMRETGGDAMARAAAVAPIARTLNTLNLYETRKRRAAKAIQLELDAFEQSLAEASAAPKPEIGSVCSSAPKPAPTEDKLETLLEEIDFLKSLAQEDREFFGDSLKKNDC